jgi:fumarate hydratase subunit beta
MSGEVRVQTPLTDEVLEGLQIGDRVLLTGAIYTARDAAHKRLVELIRQGQDLPWDVKGQVIYYVGPTPPRPGQPIGSAGPTSSYRMDPYTPALLAKGLKGMIGKGARSAEVIEAMKQHKAVYFASTGGAGALLAKRIKRAEVVVYGDLGTEAVRLLEVEDFPVILINDVRGNDLYRQGRNQYRKLENG